MKITVRTNTFHAKEQREDTAGYVYYVGQVLYEGTSEAQAIKTARKHNCTACCCGGPVITRDDGRQLYNWQAGKPFVERTEDDAPFWD